MEIIEINTKIAKAFKINILEVQDMVKEYQKMTLIEDDEASYKICRHALTSCIRTRTGIDKRRLELNSKAQNEIKGRNAAAKQLAAIIAPAEEHLTGLVKGEDNRIQAIQAEEEEKQQKIIQERVDELIKVDCVMPFMEIATLSDEEYTDLLQGKTQEYEAEQAKLAEEESVRKAEAERLEKVRKEQEIEAKRLVEIQTEIEKEQEIKNKRFAEIQAEIDAKEKALNEERDHLEREEADRQAKELARVAEIEAKEDARIQAEKDAEEKVEREAFEQAEQEKAEAEKKERQEALKPDKNKTLQWLRNFDFPPTPDIENQEMIEIVRITLEYLDLTLRNALKEIEEL